MANIKRARRTLRRAGTPNMSFADWNSGKKIRKFVKSFRHLSKLRDYYLEHELPIPKWTVNEPIKVQRKALSYYLVAYPQIPKSMEIEVKKWDQSLFDESDWDKKIHDNLIKVTQDSSLLGHTGTAQTF